MNLIKNLNKNILLFFVMIFMIMIFKIDSNAATYGYQAFHPDYATGYLQLGAGGVSGIVNTPVSPNSGVYTIYWYNGAIYNGNFIDVKETFRVSGKVPAAVLYYGTGDLVKSGGGQIQGDGPTDKKDEASYGMLHRTLEFYKVGTNFTERVYVKGIMQLTDFDNYEGFEIYGSCVNNYYLSPGTIMRYNWNGYAHCFESRDEDTSHTDQRHMVWIEYHGESISFDYYGFSWRFSGVNFNAQQPTIAIVYNPNGAVNFDNGDTPYPSFQQAIVKGVYNTIRDNPWVYHGNKFIGWNTAPDGSGVWYPPGSQHIIGNSFTLYAQWEELEFKATVDPNGGTWKNSRDIQEFILKFRSKMDFPDPIRIGYKFTWNINGRGTKIENKELTMGYENATIRADWEPIKYKIRIHGNVPSNSSSTLKRETIPANWEWDPDNETYTLEVEYNDGNKIGNGISINYNPKQLFSLVGYKIDQVNYYKNKNCTGSTVTKNDKNLTTVENAIIDLYIKWEPIKYTIRFNGNGNWNIDQGTYSIEATYDQPSLLTNKFIRKTQVRDPLTGQIYIINYKFLGWSFNENGIGYGQTFKGVELRKENIQNSLICNFTTVDKDIVDLYAMWEKDSPPEHDIDYDWINRDGTVEIEDPDPTPNRDAIAKIILYRSNKNFPTEYDSQMKLERPKLLYGSDSIALEKTFKRGDANRELRYKEHREGINYYILEVIDRAGGNTLFNIVVKIDKTAPALPEEEQIFSITQVDLNKFDYDKVEEKIKDSDEMSCIFDFRVKEQNLTGEYAYGSPGQDIDSSGFYRVTLTLSNVEDGTDKATYVLYDHKNLETGLSSLSYYINLTKSNEINTNETNIPMFDEYLSYERNGVKKKENAYSYMKLLSKINTFKDFPRAATLNYKIELIDRAGNVTVYNNVIGNEIRNFSIKAVIHSTEGDKYNDELKYDNYELNTNSLINVPYFELGDMGYVEAWTVGYVPEIQFDFGYDKTNKSVGKEMVEEIEAKKIPSKYNLGVLDSTTLLQYVRKINYAMGEDIYDNSADCYAPVIDGITFARHYSIHKMDNSTVIGWLKDGTSIRMPIYYELEETGNKKLDGRDEYHSELHTADIYAWKRNWKDLSVAPYILYDTRADNIHYRVTHESTSLRR